MNAVRGASVLRRAQSDYRTRLAMAGGRITNLGVATCVAALLTGMTVQQAAAQFSVDTTPTQAGPAQAAPAPAGPAMSVAAADSAADVVGEVTVIGNQRIEADTVRAYMLVRAGDPFDPARMDESLKRLFATGLFADVAMGRQGGNLVVKVVENPIVNRIAFEGNKRVDDDMLQSEIQLRPRQVYTRTKVQEDVKRVLDVYRRSGRFAVTVEPKIIELEQNRVDLAFEVNEGPSTYIRRINFVGNQRFSDKRLREEVSSREERWYRFFSSADTYDPDRLTYDRELLRRFYLRNGYSDFRVVSAVAELSPDRESFFITMTVDEGNRYKFGNLDIEVSIPDVSADALKESIVGEAGDWYNADQVEETVQAITDQLGAMGYAFVDVRPRVKRDRDQRIIDVTYMVQEGPRVFVDRIDITGNVRTLDRVIRREMELVEGDAFNTAKLRQSKEQIRGLGFFEKVEVTNVPSEVAPDRTVVQVEVQEKSTGELSFGVGWSSSSGALFDASLRERNLLGRGQDLKLSLSVAERKQEIDLSFTEPYFMGRRLAAGFDLFSTQHDYQDESSYDIAENGGALRMGFRYNQYLRQGFKYTLSQTSIENVDSSASTYIKQIEGDTVLSQVSQSLTYDRRDSGVEPTEGYYVTLGNDLAGLGGDEYFLRTNLSGAQYFPIDDDVVFTLRGNAGVIVGLGKDVRLQRNFNLGGDNLRGFEYGGASPRDASTEDLLGGVWIANGTAEMRFPLGLPEELGITGKAFSDFGTIGSPDNIDSSGVSGDTSLRASAGVGLVWVSPMGPVSIDLAQALLKEDYDKTEFFRFNFGTRF
jgi:outer membrane protein insertion porin family